MGHPIKCIVCDKKLEGDRHTDIKTNGCAGVVYGGLICDTTGNYGSTIFDPISYPERLEFYICDACMVKKQKSVYHVRTVETIKNYEVKTFAEYRKPGKNTRGKAMDKLNELLQAKNRDVMFIFHRLIFLDCIFPVMEKTKQEVVLDANGFQFYFPKAKVGVKAFFGHSSFDEQEMANNWRTKKGDTAVYALGHKTWVTSMGMFSDEVEKGRIAIKDELLKLIPVLQENTSKKIS